MFECLSFGIESLKGGLVEYQGTRPAEPRQSAIAEFEDGTPEACGRCKQQLIEYLLSVMQRRSECRHVLLA